MNLSIIKNELNILNLGALDIPNTTVPGPTNNLYNLTNLLEVRSTLRKVHAYGLVQEELKELVTLRLFESYSDSQMFDYSIAQKILRAAEKAKTKLIGIREVLNQSLEDDQPGILRVLLPKANDFKELSTIFNDLKIALTLPVNLLKEGGEINILTAESGSIWIVLFIPVTAAMVLIGDLVYCALFVKQEDEKSEQTLSLLSRLEDTELVNTTKDRQKTHRSKIISNEALGIANRNGIEVTPENLEYLETSIKKIVNQHNSGAVYLPSKSNGEGIVEMFPTQENKLLESKVKQLPGHQEQAS